MQEEYEPIVVSGSQQESSEAAEGSGEIGSDSRPTPPPLRIYHFMWLTVVVALLASVAQLIPIRDDYSDVQNLVVRVHQGIYVCATAIGVGMVILQWNWWRLGYAAWTQPGQWISLMYGLWSISYFVALLEFVVYGDPPRRFGETIGFYVAAASWLVGCYVLIRIARTLAWRLYFGLAAVVYLVTLVTQWDPWWNGFVFMTLFFFAILQDVRLGVLRHWSHWIGGALPAVSGSWAFIIAYLGHVGFFDTTT